MISATSDGASVNFGLYNGVLTRMKASRPWLLTVHCALHRVELSLGDSLKKFKSFKDMQDYMITLFYTFKQSGNLKRCFKDTAKGLGVTSYNFPKVHGTRFIAHTRRGLDHLLKNWICLANTIESMTANKQHGNIKNLSAKLGGILKRLTDFRFLAFCCFYSNVLDIMSELSLRLEDSNILVFEVAPLVEMAISRITEIIDNPDSILLHEGKLPAVSLDFRVNDSSANGMGTSIECDLVKRGDMRKKPQNRETNRVQLENMKFVNGTNDVIRGVSRQLREIKECLGDRFGSFREEEVYSNMSWVDPANWQQTPEEDLVQIEKLSEYFHVPLSHKDFDASKVRREWKDLRILARSFYSGCNCRTFWKQIFQYRQKAFPNICVLVEHVLCIGATNGLVEAGFSHLTSMLSDRRLSTGHTTMENLLLIKINDFSWSDQDREEIIDSALEKYLMKRRVRRLESNTSFQSVMSRGLDLKQVEEEDDTREDGATTADDESDLESLMSSAEEDDIGLKDEDDDPLDDLGLDVEDYSNVLDPDHSHMDEDNRLS